MTGTLCVASALLPPVSAHDELFGVHVLQHLLEVSPIMATFLLTALHWDQAKALTGQDR